MAQAKEVKDGKKQCLECGSKKIQKFGKYQRTIVNLKGKRKAVVQRFWCEDCRSSFILWSRSFKYERSIVSKGAQLYFDAEASSRAVSRQLRVNYPRLKVGGAGKSPPEAGLKLTQNQSYGSKFGLLDYTKVFPYGRVFLPCEAFIRIIRCKLFPAPIIDVRKIE